MIKMTKHFSRRHFLQMSSVAVTYALAHDLLRQRRTQAQPIEETIVVIGAGMAGLAAARQLQNYGYQVIVLEGRERIGGRIWTDESLGVALDLGAAWIHGIEGNPIFELAQYWRIETSLTDFEASALYFGNREFSDEEYVQIETVFDEISDELQTLKETLDDDLSVGEAVDRLLADYDDLSERVRAGARWVFEAEIGLEMGENLENLSLLALGEDEEFAGDDVVFPGGYGELVERLADGLDIRVNQIVTGIYHDDEGVEIETTDGTFEGDRVIVTLPLGVLKSGDVEFDPPLPDAKQAALDRMAMGTLDKVALRFPALFWPKALHSFGVNPYW
jgi:monoamine oxidase